MDTMVDIALQCTIQQLTGTEKVIPPLPTVHQHPNDMPILSGSGANVLLLIPTKNAFKIELLTRVIQKAVHPKTLVVESVSANSEVNEQPYDEAGLQGARNRIRNALKWLEGEHMSLLDTHNIGTVLVASIENFIQMMPTPADFGAVVVYNASTGTWAGDFSSGVTVPKAYLDKARAFGFSDADHKHGNQTVGKVIAANVAGVDDANWHVIVAGVSRYDLLTAAAEGLSF